MEAIPRSNADLRKRKDRNVDGQGRSDRIVAVVAVLVVHLGIYALARVERGVPAPRDDRALEFVFLVPAPVLPTAPSVPSHADVPAARIRDVHSASAPARAALTVVEVPATTAPPAPAAPMHGAEPTHDRWHRPPPGADAPATDFRRDPLGRRKPDLVAVEPSVKLRMQPVLSVRDRLKMFAPPGYEDTACPEIQRNIDGLSATSDAASRRLLEEQLMRQEDLCM